MRNQPCDLRGVAIWGDALDLQQNNVAGAKFAIDCQIEHREIARSCVSLKFAPDRPHVLWPQWRFGARKLSFVPRLTFFDVKSVF
jgi:hypothetical protein